MKTALVTGCSGGMGNAVVRRLSSEGYRVAGLDIREPENGEDFIFIRCDLTDGESVKRAASEVGEKLGELDCIVNTAGKYDLDSLVEMTDEAVRSIFDVNVFASVRVNRLFLPLLKEGGRIVIVSSELAPLDPLPFTGIYAVTKHALESYAYSLRMELQLLGHPVVVIRPGAVRTGLLDVSTRRLDDFTKNTKLYSCNAARFKRIVDSVEAKSVEPEKIAKVIGKALDTRRPRYVYKVNRNPLLLLLNALPDRMQCAVIKMILTKK